MTIIKPLPSSIDIERSIIWCFLIDNESVNGFLEHSDITHFYDWNLKHLAEKAIMMVMEWAELDIVTFKEAIKEETLNKLGGISFLMELTETVQYTKNITQYAKQLAELYKKRSVIKEWIRMQEIGYNSTDLETDIGEVYNTINNTLSQGKSHTTSLTDNIESVKAFIEKNKGKSLIWWSWGLGWLDWVTKWIQKSKTYRIGAPSWVGKTNLMYQTIRSLLEQWAKVMFVSLENSIESTTIKLMSSMQWVNPNLISQWLIEPDYSLLEKYKDNFILTDKLFNLSQIKRQVSKIKPDVVILDYIWLVNINWCDEKSLYNKYADEVKEYIQNNKDIAWIDLSNLNKDDDEERIRQHKGFNWSAKLRNNTDVSIHMFWFEPFYEYKKDIIENWVDDNIKNTLNKKQVLTFLVSKNRDGVDWVESQFWIDFDKGINYKEIDRETIKKWKDRSQLI